MREWRGRNAISVKEKLTLISKCLSSEEIKSKCFLRRTLSEV